MSLERLKLDIETCTQCLRIREWSVAVQGKNLQYLNSEYWSKPVPGFGDPKGRLLIIGLAPGAHGANRTGRPFTGDVAGKWVYDALYHFGFSNQHQSVHQNDGLILRDVYITNVVRCVPPDDKPNREEYEQCFPFLKREIDFLSNVQVILTLGENAFKKTKALYAQKGARTRGIEFTHGAQYEIGPEFPIIKVSYHTSKRNIDTKKLTKEEWYGVFRDVIALLK